MCTTSSLGEKKTMQRKVQAASRKVLKPLSTNILPTQSTFEVLMKVDLPSAWTLSESQQDGSLLYCMLRSDPPMVIRSVTVPSDLHGYAHVLNKVVSRSNSVIQTLPAKVSAESSPLQILKAIQSAKLCPGNPEEQFVHLFEQKLCVRSSYNSAYLDNKEEIVVGNTKYHKTVRKSDCEMICSPHTSSFQHSPHCSKFHSQLR